MRLLIIFILMLVANISIGQKFVQMETQGRVKVKKFYVGDEITFSLKGDDEFWYTETIDDVLVEENLIVLNGRAVKVGDITAIRSYKGRAFSKSLSNKLFFFSGTWFGYSLIAAALGAAPLTGATAVIGGTAVGLGILIRLLFKKRTWKIGKRRRLRLMNLNFMPRPDNA